MVRGTVKWFHAGMGYGFLLCPGYPGEVFVHHKDIDMNGFRTLSDGDVVECEVENTERGLISRKVVKYASENAGANSAA